MDDAAQTRIEKLYNIIEQCRFGIHDLSRTELDPVHNLPRFNMPFELGLFLAAKRYGDEEQKKKRAIVLDVELHRFARFISDIAGMDITPHNADPRTMVSCVRDWLVTVTKRRSIPSPAQLSESYDRFVAGLPAIAHAAGADPDKLLYSDYERLVIAWVKADRAAGLL